MEKVTVSLQNEALGEQCTPLISVIVPVYNGEAYLKRCVDSILAQSFAEFELILVDDGSTDRCGKLCDEYAAKDSRLVVIHKTNGGVSRARNAGLDVARGEFVVFCDCDDYYKKNLLTVAYSTILKEKADIVSYQLHRLSRKDIPKTDSQVPYGRVDLTKENLFQFLIQVLTGETGGWQACRSVFRRKMLEENNVRFCETCNNYAEDMGFTLECLLYAFRIVFIDDPLYVYDDTRESSMMHKSRAVCRVNDLNELSCYLSEKFEKSHPELAFCTIHHYMVRTELLRMYLMEDCKEIKEWDRKLDTISRMDYFLEQNRKYDELTNGKKRWTQKIRRIESVDRYLAEKKKSLFCRRFMINKFLLKIYAAVRLAKNPNYRKKKTKG